MDSRKLIALGVLAVGSVLGAPLTPTVQTAGSWYNLTGYNINQNGTPFWDNTSLDGTNKNVGFYLTCTGYFGSTPLGCPGESKSDLAFLAKAGSSDHPVDFYFSGKPDDPFTLHLEIAGLKNTNVFGWYDMADNSKNPIFAGSDGAATTKNVDITAPNWGFYIDTGDGVTYFSNGSSRQAFALFKTPQTGDPNQFYLGVEDRPGYYKTCISTYTYGGSSGCTPGVRGHEYGNEKYGDFNDMVISFKPILDQGGSDVPEPSSYALMGAGLLALVIRARRK